MIKKIDNKKLVLFGAGKIGRSFIGQLFSRGGYEVVFIDVYKPVIDELNRRRSYNIIIKSDTDTVLNIRNVRGVHAEDKEEVEREVSTAGIAAVSVGQNGLKGIFPLLAAGLLKRFKIDRESPLDIIIAENMRNADTFFEDQLKHILPPDYPFFNLVGLVETSIGKMVPIMTRKDMEEDILQIFAEPYNTLILNKKGFRNPIPSIDGLAPKENMKAWVDRKLFIHNLGHSTTSYIGYMYNPAFVYLHEALAVPEIYNFSRSAMMQAAAILMALHPGEFTLKELEDHIDDLLERFSNKALGDTIFRVGCDLQRKLGPADRLAGAIHEAVKANLPYEKIMFALVCGFHFRAKDENGNMLKEDEKFLESWDGNVESGLQKLSGFARDEYPEVYSLAGKFENQINSQTNLYLADI